jgi:branched-chain amino acid transport system ATP-binding protein
VSVLLAVRNVSKSFRGLRAVSDVSLTIDSTEMMAVIGPNGAGKTTLFNIVAGVLRPDAGEILFNGKPIHGLRADQVCALGISRTFQIVKPFMGLSVLDNVIVGALERAANVADARRHAENILEQLGLAARRHAPPASLTLADRKRLEVARALATRPSLVLLDEAMAGLGPLECDQLIALFREINHRDGVTILLIEHVMRAVMALAHRVVVLHHGEVIAQGAPAQVVRDPAVLESYLGEDVEI